MTLERIPLGETGQRLIGNLVRLREAQRLTYAELSARLREAGREIPPLGLSRIEKGNRRVDVDDLIALAGVLGVNPLVLLGLRDEAAPSETPEAATVHITLTVPTSGRILDDTFWTWLRNGIRKQGDDL